MAATPEMVRIALMRRPDQVTLVPEKREEITTEGGLDVAAQEDHIRQVVQPLQEAGIPVSLFINADRKQIEASARTRARLIELHTGCYANAPRGKQREAELRLLAEEARHAQTLGITVNAGHGLNYENVVPVAAIEGMHELNIGHSIISRAVLVGLGRAVREMLALVEEA
jgi:pyridoxine 5-phosphate synthase